jgi:hypothetical protein
MNPRIVFLLGTECMATLMIQEQKKTITSRSSIEVERKCRCNAGDTSGRVLHGPSTAISNATKNDPSGSESCFVEMEEGAMTVAGTHGPRPHRPHFLASGRIDRHRSSASLGRERRGFMIGRWFN